MTIWIVLNSRVGATLLTMTALYIIAAFFIPARLLIGIGDAFVIPMCAAAFWTYGRALAERGPKRPPDNIDLLILGVFGGWLTNFVDRSLRLAARIYDASVLDFPVIGYLLLLLTFFAAIHVLVRGTTRTNPSAYTEGWLMIIGALIIGTILAAIIVTWHLYEGLLWIKLNG